MYFLNLLHIILRDLLKGTTLLIIPACEVGCLVCSGCTELWGLGASPASHGGNWANTPPQTHARAAQTNVKESWKQCTLQNFVSSPTYKNTRNSKTAHVGSMSFLKALDLCKISNFLNNACFCYLDKRLGSAKCSALRLHFKQQHFPNPTRVG